MVAITTTHLIHRLLTFLTGVHTAGPIKRYVQPTITKISVSPSVCLNYRSFIDCGLTNSDIRDLNSCIDVIGRSSIVKM